MLAILERASACSVTSSRAFLAARRARVSCLWLWVVVGALCSIDAKATDPLIWLDASNGLVLDNGKVATWTNLASPGTHDAVQSDAAKRPVVLLEEWSGHTL